jgi:hypothetical protein
MATYQRWVLALTATASLMVMLDVMVVVTALHTIRVQLGASIDQLEWTISAYTLSFAVLLMTVRGAQVATRIGATAAKPSTTHSSGHSRR